MQTLKIFYHRVIPARVRNPFGRWRRRMADRCRRWLVPGPLPPTRLLTRIQETPYIREYLGVGQRAARSIRESVEGPDPRPQQLRVLDFGCGLGRTLRFLRATGWELHGCDIDDETLAWSAGALPFARFRKSSASPPLPYEAGLFDVVYSISVFTHFSAAQQCAWADELARVLAPRGILLISTMGPLAFSSFPSLRDSRHQQELEQEGFFLHVGEESSESREARGHLPPRAAFNRQGAFHTVAGIQRFFGGNFDFEGWVEGGLDGFQDLAKLRRKD